MSLLKTRSPIPLSYRISLKMATGIGKTMDTIEINALILKKPEIWSNL
jgi:hypothetical protein